MLTVINKTVAILTKLLIPVTVTSYRALRSGDQNLLSVKKTRIKIGDSSFAVEASVLWNALPCQIKKARTIDCFKSMIKNHLFKL